MSYAPHSLCAIVNEPNIKEQEFKEKSLKLLADPCKLKDIQYNPKYSRILQKN